MSDERVVILCAGDLHLGRYPSRVPPNQHALSVAHIWERTVEFAIARTVDLVALTGDVVDRANRFYEAIGPLENGIRRLADHGISTFAVSGNHDFDVLPRLVDAVGVEHFHLLGRGGTWESHTFERGGKPVLRLVGWSFPEQHYARSPLDDFPTPITTEATNAAIPTVGLLHADLDQPSSRYAPVTTAKLGACRVSAWLLGHIHRPSRMQSPGGNLVLYPGSLQPLDPGERGSHGPWLIEVSGTRGIDARQVALASVRYAELELDLSGVNDESAFERVLFDRVRDDIGRLIQTLPDDAGSTAPLAHLVLRLNFVGRTRLHRDLERLGERITRDFSPRVGNVVAHIDKISVSTRPDLDLGDIARGNDPPAVLARLLIALENDEIPRAYRPLFDALRQKLSDVHRANAFSPLVAEGLIKTTVEGARIRHYVQIEGLRLLDEMLSQKAWQAGGAPSPAETPRFDESEAQS